MANKAILANRNSRMSPKYTFEMEKMKMIMNYQCGVLASQKSPKIPTYDGLDPKLGSNGRKSPSRQQQNNRKKFKMMLSKLVQRQQERWISPPNAKKQAAK